MQSFDAAIDIAQSVVKFVLFVPVGYKGWRLFRDWRIKQSRISLQREIVFFSRMAQSPSARSELAQQRSYWVFALLGIWMMVQGIAFDDAGRHALLFMHVGCGAAIYLIAAKTIGDFANIKNAAEKIAELQSKLEKLPPENG